MVRARVRLSVYLFFRELFTCLPFLYGIFRYLFYACAPQFTRFLVRRFRILDTAACARPLFFSGTEDLDVDNNYRTFSKQPHTPYYPSPERSVQFSAQRMAVNRACLWYVEQNMSPLRPEVPYLYVDGSSSAMSTSRIDPTIIEVQLFLNGHLIHSIYERSQKWALVNDESTNQNIRKFTIYVRPLWLNT